MITISETPSDLVGEIIGVCTHSIEGDYPTKYQTYDEAWDNLHQSLDFLRAKLGELRVAQLADMADQAKAHFDAKEIKLGARLMQDMEQVVKGRPPYAYPKDMYRWARGDAANNE